MKSMVAAAIVSLFLLAGCTGNEEQAQVAQESSQVNKQSTLAPAPENFQPDNHDRIKTIRDATELGLGPITKENTSLGGIRIGDTQSKLDEIKAQAESTEKTL
jgi:outer membrane murein-binding lipoprotein Lpp